MGNNNDFAGERRHATPEGGPKDQDVHPPATAGGAAATAAAGQLQVERELGGGSTQTRRARAADILEFQLVKYIHDDGKPLSLDATAFLRIYREVSGLREDELAARPGVGLPFPIAMAYDIVMHLDSLRDAASVILQAISPERRKQMGVPDVAPGELTLSHLATLAASVSAVDGEEARKNAGYARSDIASLRAKLDPSIYDDMLKRTR